MAIKTPYTDKQVLILDDLPEMRSNLRGQLNSLGCDNVAVSGTVKDAIEQIRAQHFDVILCDFYLAGGTDGQQFLEFLRSRRLIGRGVVFIMVTAEQSYEVVVTAAECLPDDYLLKPFTADALRQRLDRLMEKKARLAKVDQLQDKGNWKGVIAACDEIMAAKDRYFVDAMRIKGNALIEDGNGAAAIALYEQALAMRPLPWARLGLARAQRSLGRLVECKETLNELIGEAPTLMAAYDLLGKLHLEDGDHDAAIQVLDNACRVSPNSLARHRAIASVAEQKGDFSRVEEALSQVVKKTRNSPLRETADFARLGNALTEMGEPAKAVALLEDVRTAFKSDANDPHLAAVEAMAQHKAGNAEKAQAALARAISVDHTGHSESLALTVARACLTVGKPEVAQNILKHVVQSNPDSKELHAQVSGVLRDNGAPDLAEDLVQQSVREIIELNNEAVRRARGGELAAASAMLTEAARRLPNNLQIVANAALSLFSDVLANGMDSQKLQAAQGFQKAVLARAPEHAKLAEMNRLIVQIRDKYAARA